MPNLKANSADDLIRLGWTEEDAHDIFNAVADNEILKGEEDDFKERNRMFKDYILEIFERNLDPENPVDVQLEGVGTLQYRKPSERTSISKEKLKQALLTIGGLDSDVIQEVLEAASTVSTINASTTYRRA